MLPNFIYIGPGKTGSTWIYEALRLHPEVYVPIAKDIYFFDRYFNKGIGWYESFFSDSAGKKAVGELSHDYLFSEDACHRIKQTIPNVKLITCLRNPYELAFSAYMYCFRQGLTKSDFITAASNECPSVLEHSCYAEPLQRYISRFGRDRILILKFDELKSDPASFCSRIYDFIGVDPAFRPEEILNKIILPAGKPRNRFLASITKHLALLMRRAGFPSIVGSVKRLEVVQKVLYQAYDEKDRPSLTEKEEDFLKGYIEPNISILEQLLHEDFSAWRR